MNESEKDERGKETKSKRSATKGSQTVPGLYTYTHKPTRAKRVNSLWNKHKHENVTLCVYVYVSARVWVCLNEHNVIAANFIEQQIKGELMPIALW